MSWPVKRLLARLRRHQNLFLGAAVALGIAAMIAHWWGTAQPRSGAARAAEHGRSDVGRQEQPVPAPGPQRAEVHGRTPAQPMR
jgi:hypothetical protein